MSMMSDWRMHCNRCDTSAADLRRCTGCYSVYYCSRDCQSLDWTSHKEACTQHSDNQQSKFKCNNCSKSTPELKRCSRCYTVYYCSRDCQRLDWASHKNDCTMKTDTLSSGDGFTRKTTKEIHASEQDTDKIAVQETDNVKRFGSTPSSKKGSDSLSAEKSDQNSAAGGEHNSRIPHAADRNIQRSKANVDSKSTDHGPGTRIKQTKFPLRQEKGNCMKCFLPFCVKSCSKCKVAFYCSKKCQQSDWPDHKKQCKQVSDESVIQKDTPFTEDEAIVVDTIKRRFQRFNERGIKGRENAKHRHHKEVYQLETNNFTGPNERLSIRNPAMLKIYERPPGSLSKALRYARACFPDWTVIDDLQDIPHELSSIEMYQVFQKQSMRNVLVAFMFMYHDHVMRHGVFLKDSSDKITHVEFYFDHLDDDPTPHFSYDDVTPGNYILLQNPLVHQFQDGQVGIRINDPAEVKIGITEGLF